MPRWAGRLLTVLAGIILGLAVLLAVVAFFSGRDDASVERGAGPAAASPDHGASALPAGRRTALVEALRAGNVVLVYGSPRRPEPLRTLADEVAGPFDPALASAGQAVILTRRPGTRGVIALSWSRVLRAASATDPRLRDFAEAWLGRGAAG